MSKRLNWRKCWLPALSPFPPHGPAPLKDQVDHHRCGNGLLLNESQTKGPCGFKDTGTQEKGRGKVWELESRECWANMHKIISISPYIPRFPLERLSRGTWVRNEARHKNIASLGGGRDWVLDWNSFSDGNVFCPNLAWEEQLYPMRHVIYNCLLSGLKKNHAQDSARSQTLQDSLKRTT